jgi:hypothetical protein
LGGEGIFVVRGYLLVASGVWSATHVTKRLRRSDATIILEHQFVIFDTVDHRSSPAEVEAIRLGVLQPLLIFGEVHYHDTNGKAHVKKNCAVASSSAKRSRTVSMFPHQKLHAEHNVAT